MIILVRTSSMDAVVTHISAVISHAEHIHSCSINPLSSTAHGILCASHNLWVAHLRKYAPSTGAPEVHSRDACLLKRPPPSLTTNGVSSHQRCPSRPNSLTTLGVNIHKNWPLKRPCLTTPGVSSHKSCPLKRPPQSYYT